MKSMSSKKGPEDGERPLACARRANEFAPASMSITQRRVDLALMNPAVPELPLGDLVGDGAVEGGGDHFFERVMTRKGRVLAASR